MAGTDSRRNEKGASFTNPLGQSVPVPLWIANGAVAGISEAASWNGRDEQIPRVINEMYQKLRICSWNCGASWQAGGGWLQCSKKNPSTPEEMMKVLFSMRWGVNKVLVQ